MDKTIKELYVSPELESLEMAMEAMICESIGGGARTPDDEEDGWGQGQ